MNWMEMGSNLLEVWRDLDMEICKVQKSKEQKSYRQMDFVEFNRNFVYFDSV